jgi:hypothetical protein
MNITYEELIEKAAERAAKVQRKRGRKPFWHQFRTKKLINKSKRKLTDDTNSSCLGTYSRIVDAMIQVAS